jgi:hypothetical protein
MPAPSSTRIHETDFCAEIATFSTGIFGAHPEYPFRSARIEGFGKGAAKLKRKDLRLHPAATHSQGWNRYDRED